MHTVLSVFFSHCSVFCSQKAVILCAFLQLALLFFFTYTFHFSVPSAFNLLNVTLQLLMTEDIKCLGSYFIAKDGMQTFFK